MSMPSDRLPDVALTGPCSPIRIRMGPGIKIMRKQCLLPFFSRGRFIWNRTLHVCIEICVRLPIVICLFFWWVMYSTRKQKTICTVSLQLRYDDCLVIQRKFIKSWIIQYNNLFMVRNTDELIYNVSILCSGILNISSFQSLRSISKLQTSDVIFFIFIAQHQIRMKFFQSDRLKYSFLTIHFSKM